MVGGTTHQPQKPPTTTPEEEDLLKRNTDCVYFLASPLTCIKGSECEYRHSDVARVNPRDCWYWLNGNCLNPKCGFRHPPLDGLLGVDVSTPMRPSVTQLHTPLTPAPHATPYAMPKQGVACIFFQKGFCLKGHLCPFLHGPPNSVNNKAAQSGPVNPIIDPPKMANSGPEKPVQQKKFTQQGNVQKSVEFLLPQGKQGPRMQAPPPTRNGGGGSALEKKATLPSNMALDEPPRFNSSSVGPPLVMNGISPGRSNRGVYQSHHISDNVSIPNGKDADEYSREPSPCFDVLVENELGVGDSEYCQNEEKFERSAGHDFDNGHRNMYSEQRSYDHYNERDHLQAWEDHRASSERMLAGAAHVERKLYPRVDNPDQFDESDLRHRISKQTRGSNNGLRSVVSREHARDSHAPRRDSHHHPDQGLLSSRLRGRIKVPGRSISPGNENDLKAEREFNMQRQYRSRSSPGRPPHASSNQSRLKDRIEGRVSQDYSNNGRDYRGSLVCRNMGSDNSAGFSGPIRLSELKSGRSGEGYEQQIIDRQSLGKRKYPRVETQQSGDNLSFEGPKPLSEILKRKRGAENTALDSSICSVNTEKNNGNEIVDIKYNNQISSGSTVYTNKEEYSSVSAGFEGAEKQTGSSKDKSVNGQSSVYCDASKLENEECLIDEDALLDRELEAYDHRDGDYDYEQIEGEDYNLDEGDNRDEEYLHEDEYAKKESVMYS